MNDEKLLRALSGGDTKAFEKIMKKYSGYVCTVARNFSRGALSEEDIDDMGGEEIEGEYNDYVDNNGFRHVSFRAVLPIYEQNFALIYDVDAPRGENVRVITDETDPDFIDRIHQYLEAQDEHLEAYKAWKAEREAEHEESDFDSEDVTITESDEKFELPPEPEDFGLVLKDSELCSYSAGYVTRGDFSLKSGFFGGEFMNTGVAEQKPHGGNVDEPNGVHYDWESETKIFYDNFYYYVGKE